MRLLTNSGVLTMGLMLGLAGVARADEYSGIYIQPDGRYFHRDSVTQFRPPAEWKMVHPPHRMRDGKPTTTIVLEKEKWNHHFVATLYWQQMGSLAWEQIVNTSTDPTKYGEQYDLLVDIYGKDKVKPPEKSTVGAFDVWKIQVDGGPTPASMSEASGETTKLDSPLVGTIYLFKATGTDDRQWKIKIRGTYPLNRRDDAEKFLLDTVKAFSKIPADEYSKVFPSTGK